jgi:two-component system response regulator VanR
VNILVVEDETRVADFVRHGLKNEAMLVELAGDSETTLESMSYRSFDLVLLDLMPRHFRPGCLLQEDAVDR